ncbi:hypothetical protein ACQP3D_24895, partial [Escherichia coli]
CDRSSKRPNAIRVRRLRGEAKPSRASDIEFLAHTHDRVTRGDREILPALTGKRYGKKTE